MLLHVDHGMKGTVLDLDTSKEVPKVISLDFFACAPTNVAGQQVMDGVGTVEAYRTGADGKEVGEDSPDGWRWLTYTAKGRFRFVPAKTPTPPSKLVMGAPTCGKCGSTLVLRGDELCPACRAVERGQHHRMKAEKIDDPFAVVKCESCSRQATWTVSDEVETTAEITGVSSTMVHGRMMLAADLASKRRWAWDKAAVVDRRHYCDRCYQPPRVLDARGEVIQQLDDIGARPQ